jgi:cell division protein FtsA
LRGLPEAHAVPGFTTLAGLVLYAAEDPIDIRAVGTRHQITGHFGATAMARRLWHAMKEYF